MRKILFLSIVSLLISTGCSGGGESEEDKVILSLNKSSIKLNCLDETTIEANVPVKWSSDNEYAVSIDEDGKIKANKVGSAVITASSEEYGKKRCTVDVEPRYTANVNGIPLTWEELSKAASSGALYSICYGDPDVTETNDKINDIQVHEKNIEIYFKTGYGDGIKNYIEERYKIYGGYREDGNIGYIYYNTINPKEAKVVIYAGYSNYYNHKVKLGNSLGSYFVAVRTNVTLN